MALSTGRIVFAGNSLTQGRDLTPYPTQLMTLFGNPAGLTAHNLGVSARTTSEMTAAAADVDTLFSAGQTNICVAWEVTNDIVLGAKAIPAFVRFYRYCNARRTRGWTVMALTVLPRSDNGCPGTFEQDRQSVNRMMRQSPSSYCDVLVDVAADPVIGLAGSETNPAYYSPDRVHLMDAGDALVARYVVEAYSAHAATSIPI